MEGGTFIIFLVHIPYSFLTPSPNPMDKINLNIFLYKGQSSSSPFYGASPPFTEQSSSSPSDGVSPPFTGQSTSSPSDGASPPFTGQSSSSPSDGASPPFTGQSSSSPSYGAFPPSSSPSYGASPPKQAQGYQDYQVGGCSSCSENVESLSSSSIASLTEAMRNLHASSEFERLSSIHGEPVRRECGNRVCCIHGVGAFLPWHRAYLDSFKSALGTTLPYWDWTTSCFPRIARSGPFSSGLQVFNGRNTSRRSSCLRTGGRLDAVLRALDEDDFLQFSTQLENEHDSIHVGIGGSMGITGTAAYDPIFYLHHSFVDLVWAVYQVLKPDSVPPNSGQGLVPFGRTVGSTLSTNRFNLDINSNRTVFGGMTLAQIQNRISGNSEESGASGDPKIYAGFFKRNFGTSGRIKFNICNRQDCSYYGGEVTIFGGKREIERPFYSSVPTKVDVTDAVKRAQIENIRNLKFNITSFEDLNGKNLKLIVANPIRIVRIGASGKNILKRYLESNNFGVRLGARGKGIFRAKTSAGLRKRYRYLNAGRWKRFRQRKGNFLVRPGTGGKGYFRYWPGIGEKGIYGVRQGAGYKGISRVRPGAGVNDKFGITPVDSGNSNFGTGVKDFYCIILDKGSIQPPTIRIPKRTLFQIDSPYEFVMTTKNERNYRSCDKRGSYPVPSSKPLKAINGNYYIFDDNCKPRVESSGILDYVSMVHIVKE